MRSTDQERTRRIFGALQEDTSAKAFLGMWQATGEGEVQANVIGNIYTGELLVTREAIEKGEEALMQLRQLEFVMLQLAFELQADSREAAMEVVKRYQAKMEKAEGEMNRIRMWLPHSR